MIGIIDYGMGNLRSVQKAFEAVDAPAMVLGTPSELTGIDRLVLPGVGAFADGMAQLRDRGWTEPIRGWIDAGRPFLGVCLGMQLLFEASEEGAGEGPMVPGLGVLPGRVVRFRPEPGARLKVPHMGWNGLTWERDDPLLRGLERGAEVYFVHSYFVRPEPGGSPQTSATAEYPPRTAFCASLWRDRLWATQFHPEKSQRVGLRMLANFAAA